MYWYIFVLVIYIVFSKSRDFSSRYSFWLQLVLSKDFHTIRKTTKWFEIGTRIRCMGAVWTSERASVFPILSQSKKFWKTIKKNKRINRDDTADTIGIAHKNLSSFCFYVNSKSKSCAVINTLRNIRVHVSSLLSLWSTSSALLHMCICLYFFFFTYIFLLFHTEECLGFFR